ncbi:alpha/beta hydrolase [Nonomuraea rubra]|uniref:alpha/beta hydrolase n=1 Tax=Nonomuraea rubra TaxID=46180 RepID=UPI0033DCA1BE
MVAWSHGATLATRYALDHPGQVRGLVLIDGAYPIAMFDKAGEENVRRQFRRLGWLMRITALFGLSAKLSSDECAQVVLEMDAVNGELDFAALSCPANFVVASGAHSGAPEEDNNVMRGAVAKAAAANERVTVFATSSFNHVQVLAKDPGVVVGAIEDMIQRSAATGS